MFITILSPRGTWVAQLVKCPTLDFDSGRDLGVLISSPGVGSALGGACLRFSLSLSLCSYAHP